MRKAVAEGNSTENWDSPKHYADVVTASFIGVLIIVGVSTNGTVCYVYAKLIRNRSVIKRPFQTFILTMSSVDLFSCLVGFPLDMVILLVPEVPEGKTLCVLTVFIFGVTITTDLLMLVAVNTIRYYSVMHPLKTMPRRCFFMLPLLTLVVSCWTTLPFAAISDRKVVNNSRDYYTFECRRFENTRGLDVAPHAAFCFIVLCFLIWQDTTLARKLKSLRGQAGLLAKMRPPVSGISHLAINTDSHTISAVCKAALSAVPKTEELARKDDYPRMSLVRTCSEDSMASSTDVYCGRLRQVEASPSLPVSNVQLSSRIVPRESPSTNVMVEKTAKPFSATAGFSQISVIRTLSNESSIGSPTDAVCRSVHPTSSQLESLAVPRARGNQEHEENISVHRCLSSVWTRASETSGPERPSEEFLTPYRVDSNTCSDSSWKNSRIGEKRKPFLRRFLCAWQEHTTVTQCEAALAHEPGASPEWPGPSHAPLGPPVGINGDVSYLALGL